MTKPWISSVTSAPTMCAPRSWPVLASKMVLTSPWSSPSAIALPLPTNGKRPTLISRPCCLGRRLGQADAGDLRVAVGAAGNLELVEGMRVEPLDGLDADDALVLGLVRQHRRPRDVADGVDAGHVGAAEAVGDDGAALGLHAELLEPEVLDVADHADGRDHALDGERLRAALAVVDGGGDAVGLLVELRRPWRRSGS